jgi:glycosyltransferase involved in cell wall biosynthesis
MPKRKILVFIDWYLPGYKAGGPIRSCANLVQHLGTEFDISIVTRNTDYTESVSYSGIISDEWNLQADGSRIYYFSDANLQGKNIRHLISATEYDAVYLNGIYSVYFTLYPLIYLRKKRDKLIVVAVRGMLKESAISIKKTKKVFFLRAVKVLRLFNRVVFHATSVEEQRDIESRLGSKNRIRVAGNLPEKGSIDSNPFRVKESGSVSLVSIARIAPEKNLLFALQVLQKVNDAQVVFDIYGPVYDDQYWNSCSELIACMPANIQVRYCGSISNELVASTLSRYHFLFLPTAGENFGHIILQSLTAGTPLIISDKTPWRGLPMKHAGWDLSLEKADLFVSVIGECGRLNQAEFNLLSQNAFAFGRHYQNDTKIVEENRRLFD